jgi:hypothetical protein
VRIKPEILFPVYDKHQSKLKVVENRTTGLLLFVIR